MERENFPVKINKFKKSICHFELFVLVAFILADINRILICSHIARLTIQKPRQNNSSSLFAAPFVFTFRLSIISNAGQTPQSFFKTAVEFIN